MSYGVQRRFEMRKVFELFTNFRMTIADKDGKVLSYPLGIPPESIQITEQGVNTNQKRILTFGDYLELLRDAEVKRVAEGHAILFRSGADIIDMQVDFDPSLQEYSIVILDAPSGQYFLQVDGWGWCQGETWLKVCENGNVLGIDPEDSQWIEPGPINIEGPRTYYNILGQKFLRR